jgi:glutaminyl-tRNA synthetase
MTKKALAPEQRGLNFIEDLVETDIASNKYGGRVCTRFPPEPNGYLHIGHAKSIYINFCLAAKYSGSTNLRFDDTNPSKEGLEYVDSICKDVNWLGFQWNGEPRYASDYFQILYDYAEYLIQVSKAYVCDLSDDEIRDGRGNFFRVGKDSPYRNRSVSENLDLFRGMRSGAFADGSRVLRAKIDMQSANMNMRDPLMYRIRRAHHHRTGYDWPIYPMYDYAHGISDAVERVTHSICTLEFEGHRSLYQWFLDQDIDGRFFQKPFPQQIEFARLNLTYTVMSKRFLLRMIEDGYAHGWDDPRLPTIAGLRRRGYTPESIKAFVSEVGVAKRDTVADLELLEHFVREDLNIRAKRVMCVLRPLRLIIDNMSDKETYWLNVANHPKDAKLGYRTVPFDRELYIESDDFQEEPDEGWFRLSPGAEVRLKNACIVRCNKVIKDHVGAIIELHCTWDPTSLGGNASDKRKVKGTLHWVSAAHAIKAEVRLYDKLLNIKNVMDIPNDIDWRSVVNNKNIDIVHDALIEDSVGNLKPFEHIQFERHGYFVVDSDSSVNSPVYGRTVELKSAWKKSKT